MYISALLTVFTGFVFTFSNPQVKLGILSDVELQSQDFFYLLLPSPPILNKVWPYLNLNKAPSNKDSYTCIYWQHILITLLFIPSCPNPSPYELVPLLSSGFFPISWDINTWTPSWVLVMFPSNGTGCYNRGWTLLDGSCIPNHDQFDLHPIDASQQNVSVVPIGCPSSK